MTSFFMYNENNLSNWISIQSTLLISLIIGLDEIVLSLLLMLNIISVLMSEMIMVQAFAIYHIL
jgi:hypothetical protein